MQKKKKKEAEQGRWDQNRQVGTGGLRLLSGGEERSAKKMTQEWLLDWRWERETFGYVEAEHSKQQGHQYKTAAYLWVWKC